MEGSVRFALRYLGHRPGAPLAYFTGASVDLVPGQVFPVPPAGLVLGRRSSAGLQVASSVVAPAHARVEPSAGGLVVTDLASTNGTEVNGTPVTSASLGPGDRLTLASAFDFEVVDLDAPDPGARAKLA